MGRKPTKCPKKCPKHFISLKAIYHSAYFSRQVHVSFCPPTLNQHPVFPTFNRDRKHYTSSFIHHCEQEKYQKNDALYKAEHDRFCQEQLNDKSKMLEPKPRSKNQYCHVCKDHYDDYLNHVSSPSHKQSIQRNKFSDHIEELIELHFPKKKDQQSHLNIVSSQELFLQKQLSLATVPSSQFGQTINQPRFYDQFKQFGMKGVFGFYCQQNDPNRIPNTKQFRQRMINNEEEGRIIFSPQISDKKCRVQKIQQGLM